MVYGTSSAGRVQDSAGEWLTSTLQGFPHPAVWSLVYSSLNYMLYETRWRGLVPASVDQISHRG